MAVDDLFGNLTEWQGPSCSNPHASSCVEIIPISCFSHSLLPSPHPIIRELDIELLITCFNFLVLMITLAYSFYYLLCFDQILFVRDEKRKELSNQLTGPAPPEMESYNEGQFF